MKALRTISTAFLAFLVLVSSSSFMVGMHVCMGEVQNVALFNKADNCVKEMDMKSCPKHTRPACCEDVAVTHEATDVKASTSTIHIVAPAPIDMQLPAVMISEVIPIAEASRTQYHIYDPPLPSNDLTVSLHAFLI